MKKLQVLQLKTNINIAAVKIVYARLRFAKALDLLRDKVIYMDTDSIVSAD